MCKCAVGKKSDGTNYGCRPILTKAEQVATGKDNTLEYTPSPY
jgi:hypothetical protein